MKKISIAAIFALLIIMVSCGSESTTSTVTADDATAETVTEAKAVNIKGAFTGGGGSALFLDQVYFNGFNPIEKVDLPVNGGFEFIVQDLEPGIYRLRSGALNLYLFLDGTEKNVIASGTLEEIQQLKYTVTGSAQSKQYLDLYKNLSANGASEEDISTIIDTLDNPLLSAYFAYSAIPLNLTMRYPNPEKMLEIHKKATTKLATTMSGTRYVSDYNKEIAAVQHQLSQQKIRVGFEAPNIALKNPKGKEYSLDKLRGKVVLLDFWASWCGPCRRNNPEVVEMYKKYKAKGFTVFSVSLDGVDERIKRRLQYKEDLIAQHKTRSKSAWENAIKKDQLSWEYHVSDLKKWDCAFAKSYGVSGIPKTFLLDKEGKIAAVNAHGPALEREILKLL